MRQLCQSRSLQRLKTHKTSMQDPSNHRTFSNRDTPVCTLYDLTKMSLFWVISGKISLNFFRRSPNDYFCSLFMEIYSMATINSLSFPPSSMARSMGHRGPDRESDLYYLSFVRFTSDTFYNTLRSPPGTQIVAHTQRVTSLFGVTGMILFLVYIKEI